MTMSFHNIRDSFISHGEEFRILFGQLADRTAVHAYLITGEKGTGKHTLARLMGETLLCTSENAKPCGTCRNCVLAGKDEHPNIIVIEKGNPIAPGVRKDRNTIPVEDIREMIRLCGIRPTDGSIHVVMIFDAEKMTPQAQNCLLKTLEEPPPDTCIILVTDHTESLLTTVISRCRILRIKAWNDEYILSVLEDRGIPRERAREAVAASNGSVGKALELSSDESYWKLRDEVLKCFFDATSRSDVLKISNQWKDRKQEAEEIFSILEFFVKRITESRFGERKTDLSFLPEQWQRFSERAGKENFVLLMETIANAKRQLQFSTNFQAVLEKIIFVFMGEGNVWLQ